MGVVAKVRLNYIIQDIFDMEGYFLINFTPLGANFCLLTGREECEI